MIRRLGWILIVLLLLCSCQQTNTEDQPNEDMQGTTQQLPHLGLYCTESEVEIATNGAVRNYHNTVGGFQNCFLLEEDFVVLSLENGEGYLTAYRGENLEVARRVSLGMGVLPAPELMQVNAEGIGYYDTVDHAVVFLNTEFVETARIRITDTVLGSVWLSPDWKMVYYCTIDGIVALELQTNISRLLRQQDATSQEITGIFADGKILRYVVRMPRQQHQTLLVDATTGMEIDSGERFNHLVTRAEQYFLPQVISGVRLLCFGNEENHQVLWPEHEQAQAVILFENNAIVTAQPNESGMDLCYYDLASGKCTGRVSLPDASEVWNMSGDGSNGMWFLCRTSEEIVIYHWNTLKSPVSEDKIYTAPDYTKDNVDEERLQELMAQAEELGKRFGVEILIWQKAADLAPEDYTATPEHITRAYEVFLPRLEQCLSAFPDRFFTKGHDKKLKIAIVREIAGNLEWGGMEQTDVLQFWVKDEPVLMLTTSGVFEQNFYHGTAHYMDTILLSKSSAAYEWNSMNPKGFQYDNSYVTNLDRTDVAYTEGENRYFIDRFSMSFAKEDRARIFEYACIPGNEQIFKAPPLQEKLSRLCKGIREAFGLKKVDTVFLWEQYLKTE